MQLSVSVMGDKEVEKALRNLPSKTRDIASKRALKAGGGVVKRAAAANVVSITSESKVATGTLAKGLAVYQMKKKHGMLRVGIMVKKGLKNRRIIKGSFVRVGLYASVLEYGKKNQPPRSWLRKAAKEKASVAFQVVKDEIGRNLDKAIEAAR